ncbi:P1 family peptidase [Pseudochelatococcus contaminans]|uniref:L-aminopeptidase/D-esterase-like protein n=1 Tax=Pseudochelatococcus contaminans TaxID=1538103 RepID=A0A7W5Z685_9HYPH|nr:P1 family peptidase [Pseudochelatococcus contaminans]MBB3810241.1 L-aminopeptidase/D-esterase-like protein [Pseudochelatococcus contaminans]
MPAEQPIRKRARELGLPLKGKPGPLNAITDVPGLSVGLTTLISGEGEHAIRTGVTAILPRPAADLLHPCWAGTFSMNGNGELSGCHWIQESGWFNGPVVITNSCSFGIAHHAVARWMIREFPKKMGETQWPLPVVGETFDGWLNDIAGQHVTEAHVLHALDNATTGPVPEGNVGGGTGMISYEFKGGTGTASRIIETRAGDFTLGVLVQANHGLRPWLEVCGFRVGDQITEDRVFDTERGSIIVILATDAPLTPTQLNRIAKRIGLGMGRAGTPSGNNSGDIFLAFSTANDPGEPPTAPEIGMRALGDEEMDAVFLATVTCVDEAILNAICRAETMTGRRGRVVRAIDPERLRALIAPAGEA